MDRDLGILDWGKERMLWAADLPLEFAIINVRKVERHLNLVKKSNNKPSKYHFKLPLGDPGVLHKRNAMTSLIVKSTLLEN